jgi:FkbM family methyltransferase
MNLLSDRVRALSRWHLEAPLLQILLRRRYGGPLVQLSHWRIPAALLGPDSICYCAGVGEDIEFEAGLLKQFDARVFAFDPTPRAIRFVECRMKNAKKFLFSPMGIWSEDTTLRFYAPMNNQYVSHSVVRDGMSGEYFDAPCRRLATLMKEHNHDRIDLLKMNIEGAEYEVLQSMIADQIRPTVLAFTFEGPSAFAESIRWTRKLSCYGYQFAGLAGWAATFVLGEPPGAGKGVSL